MSVYDPVHPKNPPNLVQDNQQTPLSAVQAGAGFLRLGTCGTSRRLTPRFNRIFAPLPLADDEIRLAGRDWP